MDLHGLPFALCGSKSRMKFGASLAAPSPGRTLVTLLSFWWWHLAIASSALLLTRQVLCLKPPLVALLLILRLHSLVITPSSSTSLPKLLACSWQIFVPSVVGLFVAMVVQIGDLSSSSFRKRKQAPGRRLVPNQTANPLWRWSRIPPLWCQRCPDRQA